MPKACYVESIGLHTGKKSHHALRKAMPNASELKEDGKTKARKGCVKESLLSREYIYHPLLSLSSGEIHEIGGQGTISDPRSDS